MNEQLQLLRNVREALRDEDYPAAIGFLERTVQLAQEQNDVGAEGRHLGNLALIYYRLNQPEEALHYFEEALDRARQENDQVTEGGLLGNIGNILRELGHYQEAINYLNHALAISQEIGDMRGRGIWLSNLGLVYDDLEQPQEARGLHENAVGIARQLQDQRGLFSRLSNLGNSYVSMQVYDAALGHFEEAIGICRQMGEKKELALRLGIVGNLYAEIARSEPKEKKSARHFGLALQCYEESMHLARELGDPVTEAQLLRSIATVLVQIGQFEHALQYYETARQYFSALGIIEEVKQTAQIIEVVAAAHRAVDSSS